ncbi:MAG TPA: hypothetical protein VER03_09925 [Bryobacteraceae bacterium]|nr:hypothetical protein [Bryobacteraceae bacterium]
MVRVAVAGFIVCVAAVAVFGASRGATAGFRFEAELARVAQPSGEVVDTQWIRIRRDGTQLTTGGMPLLPFLRLTSVVYPDWRAETYFDLLPVPFSFGRSAPGAFKAERNCVLPGRATVLGMQEVEGYHAVVVRTAALENHQVTRWEVPELGCVALRTTEEVVQPDGSAKLVSEVKPVWVRKASDR